jgi:hypothetical protein
MVRDAPIGAPHHEGTDLILRSPRAPEQAKRERGRREWRKMKAGISKDGHKHYNGAALLPRASESFEASDATTMTTAISAITSVQIALISGFTPSRTSE